MGWKEAMKLLNFHSEILLFLSSFFFSSDRQFLLLTHQRTEKFILEENTSFPGPLPLTAHVLFNYCYHYTVFSHFFVFMGEQFKHYNEFELKYAQEVVAALKLL